MNLGTSPVNVDLTTSNIFVECWLYLNSGISFPSVISVGSGSWNWVLTFNNTTLNPRLGMKYDANNLTSSVAIAGFQTWSHVAFSFNRTSAGTGTAYIFTNGQLGGSMAVTGLTYSAAETARIAGFFDSVNYFNGYIRDLRVVQGGVVPVAQFTPLASAPFSYASPTYVANMGTTVFTLLGQFVTYPSGKFGQGLSTINSLSAVTSYLKYIPTTPITESTGFSISCWVNFLQLPDSGKRMSFVNLSNGTGFGQGVWLAYNRYGSGMFELIYENTGVSFTAPPYNLTATIGTWYHICGTIGGGSANIYVNGAKGTTLSYSTTGTSYSNVYLCCHVNGAPTPYVTSDEMFSGTMDDLRIYNTALTAAQVRSIYTQSGAPASNFRVMPQPKLAWDFNGTTAPYIGSATGTTTGSVSYANGKYIQAANITNTPTGTPNTGTNYITWTNYGTFNPSVGVTACFWINVNALPASGQQSIPLWMRGSAVNSAVYITLTPTYWGAAYTDGTNYYVPTSSTPLSTGVWYHLTVVVGGGIVTGYQNGVQIASPVAFSNPLDVSGVLYLGGNGNYGPASAIYDDLRIYDRALTSSQVQSIYNQQGMPGRGTMISNDRQIYVAPTGIYPSYTPTSGAQFPVFNTSNVSFYSSGGTSVGTVGQYLAFGSQTFNMARGFSAVCQFAWTNGIGVWERIFDFGNGAGNNNILLTRTGTSTNLLFSYRIGSTEYSVTATGSIPAQNTLYMVIAIYDPSKPLLSLYVNGTLTSSIPAVVARDTQTLTQTYVGRSNWGSDAYSNVNVNYLSVYNRVLTSDEINRPLPTPQITLKGAPLFNQLSPSATSSAVGAFSLRAVNGVSTRAVQVRPQGQFPPVAMTSNGPQNMTGYSFGGSGNYTASASTSAEPAFYAFDNNLGTFWHTNYPTYNTTTGAYDTGAQSTSGYLGEWLQIKMPTPILLISYSLIPRSGFETTRSPRDFKIFGSNDDGASWTILDTQTNINTWASPQVAKTFTISNPGTTYFNTIRIAVNAVRNVTGGVDSGSSLQIATWNLVGSPPSADFYADERGNLLTAPVVGTTLQNWLGGATGYVTKWYDQSGRGNDASQITAANQPIIQRATKGPGYSTLWPGLASTRLIYGTSSNLFDSTNYSVCVAAKRTAAIATTTYYAGTNGQPVTNQNLGVGYSNDTTLRLSEYGYSLNAPTVSGYAGVSEPLGYDFFTFSQTSGMRNYTWWSGTSASNANTGLTTPLTRSGNSTIGGTNDSASFTGEIYELLVFTQSLYDLDGTTSITQIYQNQLSAYGT
jgi:hypothetical protein